MMWVPGSEEWKPLIEPCVYVWRAGDPDDSAAIAFDVQDHEEAVVEFANKYWESSDYEGQPELFNARLGPDGPIYEVRLEIEWEPIFSARVMTETEPNTPEGPSDATK